MHLIMSLLKYRVFRLGRTCVEPVSQLTIWVVVDQWLEGLTSHLKVAGSIPVWAQKLFFWEIHSSVILNILLITTHAEITQLLVNMDSQQACDKSVETLLPWCYNPKLPQTLLFQNHSQGNVNRILLWTSFGKFRTLVIDSPGRKYSQSQNKYH